MTIPNVTTTLDDDSFFVNLNGEESSEHVSVFIDINGTLNDAIGYTSEREQRIIRESSLQNWVYRLYSEKATGIVDNRFQDESTINSYSYYLGLPFIHPVPGNIFGQSSYEYAKTFVNQHNNYGTVPDFVSLFSQQTINNVPVSSFHTTFIDLPSSSLNYFLNKNINVLQPVMMGSDNYVDEFSFVHQWFPTPQVDNTPPIITDSSGASYALGLTAGNQFADQGYKRWPFGPISPWDNLWWSVYNFLEYGGQAIIVSPDALGQTSDNITNVLEKLKKQSLNFDSIVCLTNVDNEIARNIANLRKDCIAITTLERAYTPDDKQTPPRGNTLDTIPIPPKPEGLTGSFRFKVLDLYVNSSDFGSSAEFKSWLNNDYLDEVQYPSRVSNFNINTGGVSYSSQYGLGTGEIHLVKNYIPFKELNIGIDAIYYNILGLNDITKKSYGPGIDGSLRYNAVINDYILSELGLPFGSTYEISSQYTEAVTGDLALDLPNAKIIIRRLLPNKSFFNVWSGSYFYPASDIKVFGKQGVSLDTSRVDIIGTTGSSYYLSNIVNGYSGSTLYDGRMAGITAVYIPQLTKYFHLLAIDDSIEKNYPNIWSRYFSDNENCPNLNWFDFYRPFCSPFIDVRKTFDKAREQYYASGNERPTLDNLIFIPSDKDGRISTDLISSQLLQWPYYNQAATGVFYGNPGEPPIGTEVGSPLEEQPFWINDLVWAYYGWPSNRFDGGYGFETLVSEPTDYYIPDNLKNRYATYHAEQNFLENQKIIVSILNGANIYGPTLGSSPGEPGYLLREFPESLGKYWGCTCADLPQFFRDYFKMGTTYGGIPGADFENASDLDINGYTQIECIEFGPNETTGQVTAEGSTYAAFIAFRNPHESFYMDYRTLDGELFGGTAQEYPNFGITRTTDNYGNSILWKGQTLTNTHPGYTRGGTMGNIYLPYHGAPLLMTLAHNPVGGVRYGFYAYANLANIPNYPFSQTLKLHSSLGGD